VRGNLDRDTLKAIVIGKGNRQAVVRFTGRAVQAIDDYLSERSPRMDGNTGKPLASLNIFARHDMGAGKKVKHISPKTGDHILAQRVAECLGPDMVGIITPHTLRHRFVTQVLHKTGNLKLAKDLARHKNIAITQIYAHLTDDELDEGYKSVFEK
jgi:site-specific recombinase XerD